MGHERVVVGRSGFEAFVREMKLSGAQIELVPNPHPAPKRLRNEIEDSPLRMAEFRHSHWGRSVIFVAEEVLTVEDEDCDGAHLVTFVTYPKGQRPPMTPYVLED